MTEVEVQYNDEGFVENYVCPKCGGKVTAGHTDDIGTKWFQCEKCGEQSSKIKSAEREKWEEAITPRVLEHLNRIENPAMAGETVVVEAVVSSTSVAYLVPRALEIEYEEAKGEFDGFNVVIQKEDPVNIKFVGVNDEVKDRRLKRLFAADKKVTKISEECHRTVYRVRIRPPVFTLEKRGEKIVDEKGFEYKAFDVFVVADENIAFRPSSLILIEGVCVPNPRTQKTTLLIHDVEFPSEARSYDVEKLKQLKEVFQDKNVHERLEWILVNFERYSQIVGRRNLAKAGLLCYFTPTYSKLNGEIQRGWGIGLFIGDTTTAKSETIRKLIRLLAGGMLVTAETASTVGLTGTATQVEREGWFVDWGFLPLCDRKLLAVDGAHKLSLSNWAVLAESERSGVVAIAKAAKDTAYARTRQVKIANPVDREEPRKYSTQTLASFLHPCQALGTILDKTSIARLDLAVFSDQRDVAAEDINKTFEGEHDERLGLLAEALKWCWSDQTEIIFTEKAVKTLLEEATKLHKTFFCESIPLVSIDMKWKLARLSSALANVTLSTEDFKTVIVTEDHVKELVDFLRDEYSKAGLGTLAKETRFERVTLEDVDLTLANIAYTANLELPVIEEIFKFIVIQGRVTRDQIRTTFELSEKNQLRPLLAVLSSEKLIRPGKGFYPTQKLIESYKLLVAKVTKVTKVPEGLLNVSKKHSQNENVRGSPHRVGKVGNLGKINIKTVLNVEPLNPGNQGKCLCGTQEGNLVFQVNLKDGTHLEVCLTCGQDLKNKLEAKTSSEKTEAGGKA